MPAQQLHATHRLEGQGVLGLDGKTLRAGGLFLCPCLDHGGAMTSRAPNRGHQALLLCMLACGQATAHIHDGCGHSQLHSTYQAAIRRRDGRWAKGLITVCSRLRDFSLTTYPIPYCSLGVRPTPRRTADAPSATRPAHGGNVATSPERDRHSHGRVPERSGRHRCVPVTVEG